VNSLAFTAAVMCLFNPALTEDLSFQLSFGATLGLVLFADPLGQGFIRLAERWLPAPAARRIYGPVAEFFLFTLAAQVFTLPITALNFQRVSLSALLANPLVLPVQPYPMLLGGAALLLGMLFLPLGQLAAWLCWPLLAFTIHVAEWLAQFQNSLLNVGAWSAPLVILYFAGVIALRIGNPALHALAAGASRAAAGAGRLRTAFKPALLLSLAGLLAVGVWRAALSVPDERLHMDVLNQSGGPALMVRSPLGQAWLVDGSDQSTSLADALGRRLPLFSTRLDGLLVTAGRPAAAINALEALTQKYTPAAYALSGELDASKTLRRIWDGLLAQGVTCATLDEIPAYDLGGGAALQAVDGQSGTAVWFAAGGFQALIPGGVPPGEFASPPGAGLSLLILSPADLANMGPVV
jgi:competence protein ComEC